MLKNGLSQWKIFVFYCFICSACLSLSQKFDSYRVACAVRYFWVALLRLRLSSLDKVPEPGAPTPLTATPWPLFAMGTVLSSFAKSQLKLFICLCVPEMFLSKRFSLWSNAKNYLLIFALDVYSYRKTLLSCFS